MHDTPQPRTEAISRALIEPPECSLCDRPASQAIPKQKRILAVQVHKSGLAPQEYLAKYQRDPDPRFSTAHFQNNPADAPDKIIPVRVFMVDIS